MFKEFIYLTFAIAIKSCVKQNFGNMPPVIQKCVQEIGGGENRTLVLGKLPIDLYMLSNLNHQLATMQVTTLQLAASFCSWKRGARSDAPQVHTKVNTIDSTIPGPMLGYRAASPVRARQLKSLMNRD